MKRVFSILLISMLGLLSGFIVKGASEDINVVVYYNGLPYRGIYEGEVTGENVPDGTGKFIVSEENGAFVIEGTWENGSLKGKTRIVLEDGSTINVKYKNNRAVGAATRHYSDGSYMMYRYENGIAKGRVIYLNQDNQVIFIDRYYDGKLISEWCDEAEVVTYSDLYFYPENYFMHPIKVEGEITDIFDADKSSYIVVKSEDNHTYVGIYKNQGISSEQALVPNLRVGQSVCMYGFFDKCDILNVNNLSLSKSVLDISDEIEIKNIELPYEATAEKNISNNHLFSQIPHVEVIYAESKDLDIFDFQKMDIQLGVEYNYEDLINYIYNYSYFKLRAEAEVIKFKYDKDKNIYDMILKGDGINELYHTSYSINEKEDIPVLGDRITFIANIEGNYKFKYFDEIDEIWSVLQIPEITMERIHVK